MWKLYNINADKYVKDNHVNEIVYDTVAEGIRASTFTPLKKLNAFTFLHFSLPLIVPIYEFIFKKKEVNKLLSKHLIKDEIIKITKKKEYYELLTKRNKKYAGKNVVVATPPHISKQLLKFSPPLRGPVKAHMFHMLGEIKPQWNIGEVNFFSNNSKMLAFAHQRDNSYLFFSFDKKPNFNRYFYHFQILKHKYWNPAFNIEGNNLIEFIQGDNLYMIGDNNLCGLEPTYLYGMYAANKILGKTKD